MAGGWWSRNWAWIVMIVGFILSVIPVWLPGAVRRVAIAAGEATVGAIGDAIQLKVLQAQAMYAMARVRGTSAALMIAILLRLPLWAVVFPFTGSGM